MQEPVTSVSKKATRLSEAAAASAVVTQDDIRRLGITTLPDALRLVPGLEVASTIPATRWTRCLRSYLDRSRGFQVNAALYYVGAIQEPSGSLTQPIPPDVRGDLGVVWKYGVANISSSPT